MRSPSGEARSPRSRCAVVQLELHDLWNGDMGNAAFRHLSIEF